MSELTKEKLDELEKRLAWARENRYCAFQLRTEEDIAPLIAAARELEAARAALDALEGCSVMPSNRFEPAYKAYLLTKNGET